MKLLSFGDSFLYGSDLQDCLDNYESRWQVPSNNTWPALLAKKFNLDYICFALPGIGNKIILDDILRAIHTYGNSAVYIINWTWIDRFDYVDLIGNLELWNTLRPNERGSVNKHYFKNLNSELSDKIDSLTRVYTAIQALHQSDCAYIMTYMDSLMLDQTWHAPNSVKWLQTQCSPFLDSFDNLNFLEYSKQQKFAISKNWHPLEQAHQKAAEYWTNKLQSLL